MRLGLHLLGALLWFCSGPGAWAEGLGLRAGPFDVVIETDQPEDDFVVRLGNVRGGGGGNLNPGGAYNKITHRPSNRPIHLPCDWR
jgi:hypothetical protein